MFEQHGYYKEYWIDGKFIGTISVTEKDRDALGFFGANSETIAEKLRLSNGKIIKSGTKVTTQLHYLNGVKK